MKLPSAALLSHATTLMPELLNRLITNPRIVLFPAFSTSPSATPPAKLPSSSTPGTALLDIPGGLVKGSLKTSASELSYELRGQAVDFRAILDEGARP